MERTYQIIFDGRPQPDVICTGIKLSNHMIVFYNEIEVSAGIKEEQVIAMYPQKKTAAVKK